MDLVFTTSFSNTKYASYFREKIVFLYFNLLRKTNPIIIEKMAIEFRDVLQLLKREFIYSRKQRISDSDFLYLEYIELIYKLVVNTRDMFRGKGEHDLYYMMIFELYQVFPTLAVYLLYQTETYGCLRDIKYLCQYILEHSTKQEEDSFIEICIEFVNKKLKKDTDSLTFSIHAGSRNNVSNIAKWIPREKKQFSWLFDKLAIHWSNHFSRWKIGWLNINEPNYMSALLKAKRQYRKIISKMNKNIDTAEIKFCSRKWDEIDPYTVSKYTVMKHPRLFLSSILDSDTSHDRCNENKKKKCSQKYIEKCTPIYNFSSVEKQSIIQLPISYFVKEAFRLIQLEPSQKNISIERDLLNEKWLLFSKSQSSYFMNTIPIIDISYRMLEYDAEPFYTGLGLSILVAQRSSFGKRIFAIGNVPTWINIEQHVTFMSIIEAIHELTCSQKNTAFSFEKGVDVLVEALSETNSIIKNMKLVLFSNQLNGNMDTYYEYIQTYCNLFQIDLPHIVFWNLSKTDLCDLPSCYLDVTLLSGFSAFPLCLITKNEKSFDIVYKILMNKNYQLLSDYFKSIIVD